MKSRDSFFIIMIILFILLLAMVTIFTNSYSKIDKLNRAKYEVLELLLSVSDLQIKAQSLLIRDNLGTLYSEWQESRHSFNTQINKFSQFPVVQSLQKTDVLFLEKKQSFMSLMKSGDENALCIKTEMEDLLSRNDFLYFDTLISYREKSGKNVILLIESIQAVELLTSIQKELLADMALMINIQIQTRKQNIQYSGVFASVLLTFAIIIVIFYRNRSMIYKKALVEEYINSMSSILISINEKGSITHWNKAASRITGIKSSEAINKNFWKINPSFEKLEHYQKEIQKKNITKELLRQTLFENENLLYNIYMYPLSCKIAKGLVIRIDDISKMEEKEIQLRQAQKMESIGTLAGGLAHDFNNVLGGIMCIISLLKYKLIKYHEIKEDLLIDHLNTMEEAGIRAKDMIQQLLSLSRKQELNFRQIDLNQSLKNTINLCSNSFDKSIELKVNYHIEPAYISADSTQIEQVLLNLFVNASHAMTIMRKPVEKQGGTLSSEITQLHVDKYFCETHSEAVSGITYWKISIADTGIGMNSTIAAKIFDPFYSTKEKGKGSGLGLAMTYNIVHQHKGFIDLYSEEGLGSIFSVYFPKLEKGSEIENHVAEETIPEGKGLILIIDDEQIIRDSASNILATCGYDIIVSDNGEDGIQLYKDKRNEIVLVLLDMVMPKISGKDTYIELKKIKPDLRVLLSSGFKMDDRVQAVINLGVNGFIQKPYTLKELAVEVNRILKG